MRHLQSDSFNRKKRVRRWLLAIGSVILIGGLIYLFSWLIGARFLSISEVTVFGADAEITEAIHTVAVRNLAGSSLGIFPHANTFIYPKSRIIADIKSQFPRVQNVTISRDNLTHIRIMVNQKTPSSIVCVTLPNFKDNQIVYDPADPCYFADEKGYIFERSTAVSENPYHIYYAPDISSTGSTTDFIGSYATSTGEFIALESFYTGVQTVGVAGDAILIKEKGEYELYAGATVVYFNTSAGIARELENFVAFWNHSKNEDRSQKKTTIYDYIDLRYGSNVFYKIVK